MAASGLSMWLWSSQGSSGAPSNRPPDLPPDIGEFDRRTSLVAHHLLYALMLLIPIFGVVAYVWHGRAFDYGLLALNFGVPGFWSEAQRA
jgi:cytochrome b561